MHDILNTRVITYIYIYTCIYIYIYVYERNVQKYRDHDASQASHTQKSMNVGHRRPRA